METLNKKDYNLIQWALIYYKNDGKCSQEDFDITYDKIENK